MVYIPLSVAEVFFTWIYEGQRQILTSCSLFLLRYAVHVDNADSHYVHLLPLCRNSYYFHCHFLYIEIIACDL